MKKFVCLLLAGILLIGMFGCANAERDVVLQNAGVVNPVHDSSAEELSEKFGVDFSAVPAFADADYSYINNDPELAQASFSHAGNNFVFRMGNNDSLLDISGMYYDWVSEEDVKVIYADGKLSLDEAGAGILVWFDDREGATYALAQAKNADAASLRNAAEAIFRVLGDVTFDECMQLDIRDLCVAYESDDGITEEAVNAIAADFEKYAPTEDAVRNAVYAYCEELQDAELQTQFVQMMASVKNTKDEGLFAAMYDEVRNYAYNGLIEDYKVAFAGTALHDKLVECGLYNARDLNDSEVGYAILDLDGDGVEELLIGTITDEEYLNKMIFELFTVDENGTAQKVLFTDGHHRYYYAGGANFAHVSFVTAFELTETTDAYASGITTDLHTVSSARVQADLTPFAD